MNDRDLVKQSILTYFDEADSIFLRDPVLADRYVAIARKLAMKHRYRLPRSLQLKFCKHCFGYLRAGVNARVRKTSKTVTVACLRCKRFTRFG